MIKLSDQVWYSPQISNDHDTKPVAAVELPINSAICLVKEFPNGGEFIPYFVLPQEPNPEVSQYFMMTLAAFLGIIHGAEAYPVLIYGGVEDTGFVVAMVAECARLGASYEVVAQTLKDQQNIDCAPKTRFSRTLLNLMLGMELA